MLLADYLTQWSATQGTNGWRYGYFTTAQYPASYSETGMVTLSGNEWGGPYGSSTPRLATNYMHPCISSPVTSAVAKWTNSSYTGKALITLKAYANGADGTVLRAWKSGSLICATATISGNASQQTDATITLIPGDVVYFEVDGRSDYTNDTTYIQQMQVYSLPPITASGLITRRK